MLTTKKTTISLGAIALGIIAANLFILHLNAKTDTSEDIFLEDIKEVVWTLRKQRMVLSQPAEN